jgi:hypothetical protein
MTRRLLTSITSLFTGAAHPRAVLKNVILFVAEYGSTPYEDNGVKPCASPAGMRT